MSVFHDGKRTQGERLLLACAFTVPWVVAALGLGWAVGDVLGLW